MTTTTSLGIWAHHALAWNLGMSADFAIQNLPRALALASKAVELDTNNGDCWNTLGVVQYRAGEFTAAVQSLNQSLQLGLSDTGVPCNAFFLAMAQWQLGDQDAARRWYDKATKWMTDNTSNDGEVCPTDEELVRFRAEAEEILGIELDAPIPGKSDGQSPEAAISTEKTLQENPPTNSDLP